ncbi:PAS domain-containing protein [Methylobacterium planeticum]|uniref:PAS domain-containing protein n=1 Tax=Methylobacterium planeticum TaxID=2615211 RepID=A0A6N6MUL1_9HYPH|nr:PAS domain-containing protein [Methylobacterium planeticum]KAB1074203.1 PAS domain-containing protein [Methylobacterium planeticum]
MKHPTSRLLHSYWDRLRGERAAPERAEIEPGEIRNLLADSLILELDMPGRLAHLRLAGTRVCALFGRELKGDSLPGLWGPGSADPWRLIEIVASDTVGVVAGLQGRTAQHETIELELILLPLRHRGRTQARILGALSPTVVPHWLGLRPVTGLATTSLRVLNGREAAAEPVFARAADEPVFVRAADGAEAILGALPAPANDSVPLRRGHLLVHRGGRI